MNPLTAVVMIVVGASFSHAYLPTSTRLQHHHSGSYELNRNYRSRTFSLHQTNNQNEETSTGEPLTISRRQAGAVAVSGIMSIGTMSSSSSSASAADGAIRPAPRPFAYRVDSTEPPTLLPISSASKEAAILKLLGSGSGTPKEQIKSDTINLNNILNKAVFGTIDAVQNVAGLKKDSEVIMSGPGYASFLCLGVPAATTADDISLAQSVLSRAVPGRKAPTALGIPFCPLSCQEALIKFVSTGNGSELSASLVDKGVSADTVELYMPLLNYARSQKLDLLAMAPEKEDLQTARSQGLQFVPQERRSAYVLDPNGFIALSQDPKFRVYADRSLLKDWQQTNDKDTAGGFFAERILAHETAASVAASYASSRPDALVSIVAPTPDMRYLQGINGRIPRIAQYLNPSENKITDNAVTTILLNPTAKETLSKSRFLRLEIGTGPETLPYQSKVSDYLWFSTMPKVNMLPRLMEEPANGLLGLPSFTLF